jgi:hypothetical protein
MSQRRAKRWITSEIGKPTQMMWVTMAVTV